MTGFLLINKPSGPTSHDIIDQLRQITGIRRIGHAGTLDPFAQGLLLVGVGRDVTRNLGKFVGLNKRYVATLRLGAMSDTYDKTGDIRIQNAKFKMQNVIQNAKLKNVLRAFVGKQKQVPPVYSAKKVKGRKAYELARQGERVELKKQNIEIFDIKILKYWDIKKGKSQYPNIPISQYLKLDVHCSSGTYIRSLAHDIGQKLGCGAYLQELERLSIGNFELKDAVKLSKLTKKNWQKFLINFNQVMAAGTFEILHPGHQYFLKQAKKLGKRLIVVVARDKRAEELRDRRLRFNENQRLQKIKSLDFVDKVVLGNKQDPYQSIKKIKPDIIALGYDQRDLVKNLPEKIKKFGLHAKIARISAYFPEKYKSSLMQCTIHNQRSY